MAKGDLDTALLHRIMVVLGTLRERPSMNPPCEGDLMHLIRDEIQPGTAALDHIQRHTSYLADVRLVKLIAGGMVYRNLRLTDKGQIYVQPELAEFGEKSMLPAVLKSVEERVAVLTYPEPQKQGMIHELRKAVAEKAPDLIAKVLVEIGTKIIGPGA
ncbi:MAG: hypothetical protein WAN12_10870 [Candidatus Acidiferrum sp.]